MKKLLPLFILTVGIRGINAQQLVSYNLLATYTEDQIDSIYLANGLPGFILPTTYQVVVYKVVYNTLDDDSLPIIASGAFFLPQNPSCHVPLASYQHGTILDKEAVPSRLAGAEIIVGLSMASDGYAVCMPDYLGLGDSPGLHPYVHAATEALAVADMLVAAKEICDDLSLVLNGQLFLLGYSQGGHATMAAHQLIQEHYSNYFSVTASAPMSGPYDLSGIQADIISSGNVYPTPGYLPYLLFAYNDIYHLYNNVSEYLIPPYDSVLPPLFDGTHSLEEVNLAMPAVPSAIIVPAVLDSFNNDPGFELHGFLKENDTYYWIPSSPIRMYYCEADQDVNYQNAWVAYDSFIAFGASGISVQSSGATYDHVGCALPSLLNAKFWFDSLRLDKLRISFEVDLESYLGAGDGAITAHVSSGFPPYTYLWNNGGTDSVISGLSLGTYSVTVTDSTGCPASGSVYLPVQIGIEEIFAQQISIQPNPFWDVTMIQFPAEGRYTILLSDISGKILRRIEVEDEKLLLSRDRLPAGIYFISITNSAGLNAITKLVAY